jgi:hypothetical protein
MAHPSISERQENRAGCPNHLPVEKREVLHQEVRAQDGVGNSGRAHDFIDHRVTTTETGLIIPFRTKT